MLSRSIRAWRHRVQTPAPIPGLAGAEHVGLIVPDLEIATTFLRDVLGAETLYDIGPLADPDDWIAAHLVRPFGGRIRRLRVVRIGNGPVLELFEAEPVSGTAGSAAPPAAGFHVAFYVEDMEPALQALRAHGVAIDSGPVEMTEGPSAGMTWLYFRTPWGQSMELVSYPGGIAAYRERRIEVWRPGSRG
jgi:catechol 2,3-dioxygenase-like lactoylglutathione lyase family enzyme